MIHRKRQLDQLAQALNRFPVVALLGPRQVGKTTLARQLADMPGHQLTRETTATVARNGVS